MSTTTESKARETLHWLDSDDATERGWWYRAHDGVLDIVESGRLNAASDIDDVIAAMMDHGLITAEPQ